MYQSKLKTALKIVFGVIAFGLIARSLIDLGLSIFIECNCPVDYRIRVLGLFLVGEIILGLICYFLPSNSSIEDFLYINFSGMTLSSAFILIDALIYRSPKYGNMKSFSTIFLLFLCAFITISFFIFQLKKEKLKKRNQSNW